MILCMKDVEKTFDKVLLLVLDSVGIGAMPDAKDFGDEGANTLVHCSRAVGGLRLPVLESMGLGNLAPIEGVHATSAAVAHHGVMAEVSKGKDTTTGHWEMTGIINKQPFATFPDGFPHEIMEAFERESGFGWIGNMAASGTEIIERLGPEHCRTGKLIVYTSADSVFQIAAHEGVVPLERLYAACEAARRVLDPYRVARVIARPFVGEKGAFRRTYNRRDFSIAPPSETLLDHLSTAGIPVIGIGKIHDIFAGRGLSKSVHTEGNRDGLEQTEKVLQDLEGGFVFTNLVDFDMLYGHRRDPIGYARALEEVDAFLPRLLHALGPKGLLIITADHGCDPTASWSTDHTREYVPLIVWHSGIAPGTGQNLGIRGTFADVGKTITKIFGIEALQVGTAISL